MTKPTVRAFWNNTRGDYEDPLPAPGEDPRPTLGDFLQELREGAYDED